MKNIKFTFLQNKLLLTAIGILFFFHTSAQTLTTKTIGLTGDYTSITQALNSLSSITGPYLFLIQNDYNSNSEPTFPIVFGQISGASSTNTITFKPAPGASPSIIGVKDGDAILRFVDCNYYIIDGSNSMNGKSQDLLIKNNSNNPVDFTLSQSYNSNAVIRFSSYVSNKGVQNSVIKNCKIEGYRSGNITTVATGIIFHSEIFLTSPDDTMSYFVFSNFSNNLLENNAINNVKFCGIALIGSKFGNLDVNNVISNNTIGNPNQSGSAPNYVGIYATRQNNLKILNNEVQNVSHIATDPNTAIFGRNTYPFAFYNCINSQFQGCYAHNINVSSGGYLANIYYNNNTFLNIFPNAATNNIFFNNAVHDINYSGTCNDSIAVSGFDYYNGKMDSIIFNSVVLLDPYSSNNKVATAFKYYYTGTGQGFLTCFSNIFSITNSTLGSKAYTFYLNGNFSRSFLNANNFGFNILQDSPQLFSNNNFAYLNGSVYKYANDFFEAPNLSTPNKFSNYSNYLNVPLRLVNQRFNISPLQNNFNTLYLSKSSNRVTTDIDLFQRATPPSIGAYEYKIPPALTKVYPALIKTNDTLTVVGYNFDYIKLRRYPDSTWFNVASNITIQDPLSPSLVQSVYKIVIPNNFKNSVYEVFPVNNSSSLIGNPFLIRVYNFSPDSVFVKMWGNNDYGQINQNINFRNAVHIGLGYNHLIVINKDGQIFSNGNNANGQRVNPIDTAISTSAGLNFSSFLTQKANYAVGSAITNNPSGYRVDSFVLNLASGTRHVNYVDYNNVSKSFGISAGPELLGSNISNIYRAGAGGFTSYNINNNLNVTGYGLNNFGQTTIPMAQNNGISWVAGGHTHTTFLKTDKTIFGLGKNTNGQINIPAGLSNIDYINNGAYFSNALTANQIFYAWGQDFFDTVGGYLPNPAFNYTQLVTVVQSNKIIEDVVALGEGIPYLYNAVIQRLNINTSVVNGVIEPKKYFKWNDNIRVSYFNAAGAIIDSIIVDGVYIGKDSTQGYTFNNAIVSHTIRVVYTNSLPPDIYKQPAKDTILFCPNSRSPSKISIRVRATANNTGTLTRFQWYRNSIDTNINGVPVPATVVGATGLLTTFDTILYLAPPTDISPDISYYYVVVYNSFSKDSVSKTSGPVISSTDNIGWLINNNQFLLCVPINQSARFTILFSNPSNIPLVWSLYSNDTPSFKNASTISYFADPNGIPNLYNSNYFTINQPTKKYFVITFNFQDGCKDTSNFYEIQWYDPINLDTIHFGSQLICKGQPSQSLGIRGGIDTNQYQIIWLGNYSPILNQAFIVSRYSDSNFMPVTIPNAQIHDTMYYFAITRDRSYECSTDTTPFSNAIIINYPKIISQSPIQNVTACQNDNLFPLYAKVSPLWSKNVSYEWYQQSFSNPNSKILIGSDSILIINTNNFGLWYYYCLVRSLPSSSCPNLTDTSKLSGLYTIYPNPIITSNLRDTQICSSTGQNILLQISASSPYGIPLRFNWYSNTSPTLYNGTLISGANSNSFVVPKIDGINYYYAVISNNNASSCKDSTRIVAVNYLPKLSTLGFTATLNGGNLVKCILAKDTAYVDVKLKPGFNVIVKLYENTTKSFIGSIEKTLTIINSDSFVAYNLVFNTPTIRYYYTISTDANGCTDTSQFFEVQWYQRISIFTGNLNGNIYCKGAIANPLIVTTAGLLNPTTTNFYWYGTPQNFYNFAYLASSGNDTTFIPSTIPSANINDTMYYFVLAVDKMLSCSKDTSVISGPIIIDVPTIVSSPIINNPNACHFALHDSLTILVDLANVAPNQRIKYNWFKNNSPNFIGAIAVDTFKTILPSSLTVDTSFYFCVVEKFGSGCLNSNDTSALSVPILTFPIPVTATLNDIDTCHRLDWTFLKPVVNYSWNDQLAYSWYSRTSLAPTPILITTIFDDTFNIGRYNIVPPFYLNYIVSNAIGCKDTSNLASVNLRPTPQQQGIVSIINNNDTVLCLSVNSSTGTKIKVTINNPFYNPYYKLDTSILLFLSTMPIYNGIGVPISQNRLPADTTIFYSDPLMSSPVNTSLYYYTVVKNLQNCSDTSKLLKVQIYQPQPLISINLKDTNYCKGVNSRALVVSSQSLIPSRLQYQWYGNLKNAYPGAVLLTTTQDSFYFPSTNPELALGDTSYYFCIAIDKLNQCVADTSAVSGAIVLLYPKILSTFDNAIHRFCQNQNGDTLNIIVSDFWKNNVNYSWHQSTLPNYLGASTIANFNAYLVPNINNNDTFYFYGVVTSKNICPGLIDTTNISGQYIVYPYPNFIVNPSDLSLCYLQQNVSISALAYYPWQDPLRYLWYVNLINDTVGKKLVAQNIQTIPIPTTSVDTNYFYFAVAQNPYGCSTTSRIANVITHRLPTQQGVYVVYNDSINRLCYGFNDSNFISVQVKNVTFNRYDIFTVVL